MTIEERLERDRKERMYLAQRVDKRIITMLKRRFGTEKACFLPTPRGYDPLDAMRRDAYREVVAWLETQMLKGQKELNQNK